jgi:hypothetical protein
MEGEKRVGRRAVEGRAMSEEQRKAEEHPLRMDLLKSQAEENRSTAQMRKNRDAAANEAKRFEGRLIELQKRFTSLQKAGKPIPALEIAEYNRTAANYNVAVQKAQSFGMALMSAFSGQGGAGGFNIPPLPTIPPWDGGGGEAPAPAGAAPAAAAGGGGATPKVRVQGPNGETGTMEMGDELPAGWRIIK